ncbi:MAG: hypothetical protein RIB98_03905 [Acidimicrobiales bacterium]
MKSPLRVAATASFVLLTFAATACGSDATTDTSATADTGTDAEHGEPDVPDTAVGDDVLLVEVLDVDTGEPTTIADAATGDRPVLLWFWAPH